MLLTEKDFLERTKDYLNDLRSKSYKDCNSYNQLVGALTVLDKMGYGWSLEDNDDYEIYKGF